jgi:RNA polymerase sigma factor (TIGR02999 family)
MTFQTTALVNEALLHLFAGKTLEASDHRHFLNIAAQQMRRILIDRARAHHAAKRDAMKVSLEDAGNISLERPAELLALDDALKALSEVEPRAAKVVEQKYFGGYTDEETAEILGINVAKVRRDWSYARAWLHDYLTREIYERCPRGLQVPLHWELRPRMPQPVFQTLDVKNQLSEVERVNHVLRDLWARHALPEDFEAPVTMCLEEVLSNVIRHGCLPGRDYEIQVRYRLLDGGPGGIEVEVSDNARPFDPLSLPPPDLALPLEQRRAGGLGVFLVRKMMDEVRYEHRDGRNHLLFRKRWKSDAPTL